jgi:hypothetical protein
MNPTINLDMKKILVLFLLPFLPVVSFAAETESSGTQSISIAASSSDRYELLSIALNATAVYSGTITDISDNTLTLDSADFSDSDLTTYPHFLRVKADGSNQGTVFLIIAKSDDSVTVNTDPASLSADDEVTVIPAHTLASLFGKSTESISSISVASDVATVTTSSSHGLNTGDQITLAGISGSPSLNADQTITRTGDTTFSIDSVDATGGSYSGGTWYQASWPDIGSNTTSGDSTDNNEILSGKPASADNVIVWTTYGWKTYFYYNSKWQTYGTRSSQDFTVVYPDEGLVLVRRDTDSYALTLSGTVPAISSQSFHPAGDNKFLLSNPYPVPIGLADLGLHGSGNWTSNNSAASADQVLVWTGSSWSTFYKKANGNWYNASESSINYSNVATATATAGSAGGNALQTSDITVTNQGTGYQFGYTNFSLTPAVSITGGGGSGATATATMAGDGINTTITITSGGSGYTSAPTITIGGTQIPSGASVMVVRQSGGAGGNEYVQASSPY